VTQRMVEHLEDFQSRMSGRGSRCRLYTMQANGGRATFQKACKRPVNVTNSGPIAGAIAGAYIARIAGFPNAITLDMGGTSCDVSLIDSGRLVYATESSVEGYPVQIPTIDLNIVGAGGGSIAWLDKGQILRVGPQSAGAVPGPVCYGLGGRNPTVTDANLITGRLNPEYFLGGETRLDCNAAEAAVRDLLARPMNLSLFETARGILEVANATMVRAIKLVSVQRGYDPHDFALVAFGGAGPLHAVWLAKELEIPVVIIPPFPGNTSAMGLVLADARYDHVATRICSIKNIGPDEIEQVFLRVESDVHNQLLEEGIPEEQWKMTRSCDLRYFGQAHELNVPVRGNFTTDTDVTQMGQDFHDAHRRTYGHAMEGDPIDLVNCRVTALGLTQAFAWKWMTPAEENALKGRRDVYFHDRCQPSPVYERCFLAIDQSIKGPAIIEQADSTTVLAPGDHAKVDQLGNLIIAV
jgi:N-methylhydantoinase A